MSTGSKTRAVMEAEKLAALMVEKQTGKITMYQKVFGTPEGKRVVHDLMDELFMLKPTLCERDEGKREAILYILCQLETDVIKLRATISSKTEADDVDLEHFNNTY